MTPPPIALYFDPDAYTETHGRGAAVEGTPRGLMGRQVAGKEFLDAYLAHGRMGRADRGRPVTRAGRAARASVSVASREPRSAAAAADRRRSRSFSTRLPAPIRRQASFTFPARRKPDSPGPGTRRAPAFALSGVTHTLVVRRGRARAVRPRRRSV